MRNPAAIDRATIASLVPHQGRMCLLDGVESFSAESIRARAPAPTADHPLAMDGQLPTAACIEIGLQAMALHGALLDEASQQPGFVSSLSDLRIARPQAAPLPFLAEATLLARDRRGFAYRFAVFQGQEMLVEGRATIMLMLEKEA